MSRIGRRDIIKLSAAFLGGALLSSARPLRKLFEGRKDSSKPNFIVLVLDAMSARNLSLYGYTRYTTQNLERLAAQSIVYHSHYSGGNFTTAGTASMLTGLFPWTHRGINVRGLVDRTLERRSIFGLLGEEYYRLAYTQNSLASLLLGQFSHDVDELLSRESFSFMQSIPVPEETFSNDYVTAYYSFLDFLGANGNPGSVSYGYLNRLMSARNTLDPTPRYPFGYPTNSYVYFRIKDVLDGVAKSLTDLERTKTPFLAYYHLMPPHSPYTPRAEYLRFFAKDGIQFPVKPAHALSSTIKMSEELIRFRMMYDAYIANIDQEIGVFLSELNNAGILDSSYLIITSDHGELFERNEYGHGTPLMYESVTHIPLMVRMPGQTSRMDVTSLTSNVDLLPTLLSLAGRPIPQELEGRVLPGLGGVADPERSVFSVFAKESSAFLPLSKAVMTLNKGINKLIYYRGYPLGYDDKIELFNLGDDPEELRDLVKDDAVTAKRMKEELLDLANAADAPYRRKK